MSLPRPSFRLLGHGAPTVPIQYTPWSAAVVAVGQSKFGETWDGADLALNDYLTIDREAEITARLKVEHAGLFQKAESLSNTRRIMGAKLAPEGESGFLAEARSARQSISDSMPSYLALATQNAARKEKLATAQAALFDDMLNSRISSFWYKQGSPTLPAPLPTGRLVAAHNKSRLNLFASGRIPEAAIFPEEPVRRRPVVQDATVEALAVILSGNPAGTLMVRDELAGWLNFDKYSSGNRAFWLEAYGGRPFVVDRLKNAGKPVSLPFSGVSVVGGIQPDRLSDDLLGGVDDGLVARFLWCWPDKVPFERPTSLPDNSRLECAYRSLDGIAWGSGEHGERAPVTLPLTEQAAALFENWGKVQQADADDAGPLYKGTVGKMPGTALRLALVIEYLRWADAGGPEPVNVSHWSLAAALELADDYIKPMALRVYGDPSPELREWEKGAEARVWKRP